MRSRYGAFALGLGAYLVKTLAADHADRESLQDASSLAASLSGPASPKASLSRVRERQRFMGLTILGSAEQGDTGEVLFYARVFERGADRSFAELSHFVREGGAWRYARGVLVPREALPAAFLSSIARGQPAELSRENFLEIAKGISAPT